MSHPIHTYTELQQQIHDDLRIQHPEWVKPNGESPKCDSYDACLTKMLDTLTRRGSNRPIVLPHRALEPALGGSGYRSLREVNDRRRIHLDNSVSPFSCYYSRSLVL